MASIMLSSANRALAFRSSRRAVSSTADTALATVLYRNLSRPGLKSIESGKMLHVARKSRLHDHHVPPPFKPYRELVADGVPVATEHPAPAFRRTRIAFRTPPVPPTRPS